MHPHTLSHRTNMYSSTVTHLHTLWHVNRHSQYTSEITPNSEAVEMKPSYTMDSHSVLHQQKVYQGIKHTCCECKHNPIQQHNPTSSNCMQASFKTSDTSVWMVMKIMGQLNIIRFHFASCSACLTFHCSTIVSFNKVVLFVQRIFVWNQKQSRL